MPAFGVEAWFCCLAEEERLSLSFTYENTFPGLPHVEISVWQDQLAAYGIATDSERYKDFIEIYLVYFLDIEFEGLELTVVNLPEPFWFALLDYKANYGWDCPNPCKILHFSDI